MMHYYGKHGLGGKEKILFTTLGGDFSSRGYYLSKYGIFVFNTLYGIRTNDYMDK